VLPRANSPERKNEILRVRRRLHLHLHHWLAGAEIQQHAPQLCGRRGWGWFAWQELRSLRDKQTKINQR
jgi:hypothetical protein